MTKYRRDPRRSGPVVILGLLFLAAGAAGDAGRAPDDPVAAATRTLAGTVVDAAGASVAGASVSLWTHALQRMPYEDREAFEAPQTATGPDGRFVFDAVAPGLYDLVAVPAAHPPGLLLGVAVESESTPVEVGPVRLPPGIDVVGLVVDASGEPIAGAGVTVRSWSSFPPYLPHGNRPIREAVTDERGRYRLPGLPIASELRLRYEAEGRVTVAEPVRLPGAGKPDSDPAATEPGRHRLAPVTLDAAARIELTVVDATGRPMEGTRVHRRDLSVPEMGGGMVEMEETGADGRVRLEGLAGGRWQVDAWRPGYHGASAQVELAAGETAAVELVVERADTTELEVRLLRPDGSPAAGAEVRLDTLRAEVQYGGASQTTGDDGRVHFTDVPVGIYQVRAEHPDYPRLRLDDVAIDHGTPTIEARFEELPWARVEVVGQVVDEAGAALAGAVVRLARDGADPLYFETTSDAGGRFAVKRVREGPYRVEAVHPDFAVTRQAALEVTPPGPVEVTLVLRRGATVSGELVGFDRADLHRLQVGAQQEDGPHRGGWVDSTGRYHLEALGPGAWTVTASRPRGSSARAELTVEGPEQEIDLPLVFPQGLTLSGTVLYKGRPLAGAGVGLGRDLGEELLGGSWYAAADADGRFELRGVAPGRLRLWVSHPEWGRIHHRQLELESDAELVLDLGAATASGLVASAADGQPIQGATLQIGQLDALWVTSHSMPSWADLDADGRFTIGPLEEGRWRLKASAPGHVPEEREIEIRRGVDVGGVEIELTPTPGLDLILESAAGGAAAKVKVRLVDAAGNEVAREVLYPHGEARINWEQAPPGEWRLMASNDLGARVEVPRVTVPGDPVRIVMPADGRVIVRVAAFAPGEAGAELELLDAAGRPAAGQCRGGCETTRWPINDTGYFVAWGVAPGRYTARVTAADGRTWEGEVELAPASTASLTLE